MSKIDHVQLQSLPTAADARGSMTYVESQNQADIDFAHVRWSTIIPKYPEHFQFAALRSSILIMSLQGGLIIKVFERKVCKTYHLEAPNHSLQIPSGLWIQISRDSDKAVGLIVSSLREEDSGYVYSYEDYCSITKS